MLRQEVPTMMVSNPHAPRVVALTISLSLTLCGAAAAHDFWVQPALFWTAPGEAMAITLQVGHGPDRRRTPIPLRRIVRFTALGPGGETRDVRSGLHLGLASEDGAVRLQKTGAY